MARITEELYRISHNDPDNHDGVITHLEPDILEGKVKWVLEASGGNGIPGVPFKNQKDDALKVLHSIWH